MAISGDTAVLIILGLYSIAGLAIVMEKFRSLSLAARLLKERQDSSKASLAASPALDQAFREARESTDDRAATVDRELAVVADHATAGMVWLATIGNTAPFVGLFGTVLGIMAAFSDIAGSGNMGFEAVSAGLSAALKATAAGLAVAIPAVIAYNYFGRRIQSHLLRVRYVLERELSQSGGG